MRRYCIRKELLVPVETHDKDVVALVAGGTTPAHKYAMLKKSFFRESGPVFNRISHCCVPEMLNRTIYVPEQCKQCPNKIQTDRHRTFTF
jgi:hypothetical protein